MKRLRLALMALAGFLALSVLDPASALAGESMLKAPDGLKADTGMIFITLSWKAVDGAKSYNIYMASAPGVTMKGYKNLPDAMTHTASGPSFNHPKAGGGKSYYFVVTAVGSDGESMESAEIKAP
ncbi:MAG: hypothetical protein HY751_05760 [Nitrospinae bacterium]|nr:hypothetical protein [Nitrospinota bacterium]